MSLKARAVKGLSWAFLDQSANYVIQFVIGIILARLLSPQEYGLVGMLAIFLAVADTFIIAGYGEALIRKENPTVEDYSTIFIVNVLMGGLFFGLFFLIAAPVSNFFNEPLLADLIVVMGLSTAISGLAIVPRVPLFRKLDFKSLTMISLASTLISGVTAIVLAFSGFGVWSLVWRSLVFGGVGVVLAFAISKPKLRPVFSMSSFKDLFGFGYKLLLSRLFNEFYVNVFYVLIGKFFSARELGLYTRANGYKDLPSKVLNNVVQNVTFPLLAGLQNDDEQMKRVFRKLLQATMYLSFILMFGLAGAAEQFIVGLIGPKWSDAVPYLQLLCFAGIFYPLHYMNLSILVAKGQSGMHLKVEIITKLLALPAIVLGLLWGIKWMIVGLIGAAVLDFAITATLSGRPIRYGLREQVADIFPSFVFGAVTGFIVFLVGKIIPLPHLALLALQGIVGAAFALLVSEFFQIGPYLEIKEIAMKKIRNFRGRKEGEVEKNQAGYVSGS